MEQNPSWEANSHSAIQETPHPLWKLCSQDQDQSDEPSSQIHPVSLRSILLLSSYLCLGLPHGLLLSGLPTKILHAFDISPMRATCLGHLTPLELITLLNFVNRTIYDASHYEPSPASCHFLPLGVNTCDFLRTAFGQSVRVTSTVLSTDFSTSSSSASAELLYFNVVFTSKYWWMSPDLIRDQA
jgi:hypothetical protein